MNRHAPNAADHRLPFVATVATAVEGENTDPSLLTLHRIYNSGEFAARGYPERGLDDGSGYTLLEKSKQFKLLPSLLPS